MDTIDAEKQNRFIVSLVSPRSISPLLWSLLVDVLKRRKYELKAPALNEIQLKFPKK